MSDLDARCFRKMRNPRTGICGLVPTDVMSDELLASVPDGKDVLVTVRRARNPKHHKLLWALLKKVVENTDKWPDERALLDSLKLATGLFEARIAFNGVPFAVPASISFAAMDQTRFAEWFDKAVAVLARDVLNVAPDALRAEVEEMIGGPSARRAA
jgi:hypothetical protein